MGRSVLVRAPALLVDDLRMAVADALNRSSSEALIVAPYDVETERVYPSWGQGEGPLHRRLAKFHKCLETPRPDKFFVLDFLDPLFAGSHPEQGDLIHEMIRKREFTWLAFASEGTVLPASLLEVFPIQLRLQRLRRDGLWQLLAFDEVRELLGAETLTVAHQVALYHACAGLNARQFRQCVDILARRSGVPASPLEVISELKRSLGFTSPPGLAVDNSSLTQQALRKQIIVPFQGYAQAGTGEDLTRLDTVLPRGVLLTGDRASAGADSAAFLAHELSAQLIVTHGAALNRDDNPFAGVYPLPTVVFVEDLDAGLLGDGGPLRTFLAAWKMIPADQPVFVVATWSSGEVPPVMRRRFAEI
jgi:hypothetical protein